MSAKLYFRYGAMNAAKSALLLAAAHNYEELGMTPILFNFHLDSRMGKSVIASRLGVQKPSQLFNKDTCFKGLKADAIFIDEAQFLTKKQVEELHFVATTGTPVLCYGLRTDFQGNLFEGSAALMAHAESIEELKTVCQCGCKATHVARYVDGKRVMDGDQIVIGDTNYKSMCYKCWINEVE